MKASKKLALLLVVALMISFVVGCGGAKAPNQPAASDKIKVGINYELSGGLAMYGTPAKDGILLAIEEVNKAGGVLGKQIEPVIVDNKSDNAESTSVAAKLVQEKVVAVLGPATTGKTLAAEPVITQAKIPLITASATAESVTFDPKTNKVRDYMFRVCFIDPYQGKLMGKFVYDNLKLKTAAVLVDTSNDYSKGLAEAFKQSFTGLGGTIIATEGYVTNDKEFKPTLTKILSKKPDFIYVPGYTPEVGPIVKQARELGFTGPMGGGDGWDDPKLAELAGLKNLNNTFLTNSYSVDDPDPAVQKFRAAYKAKYNSEPPAFAALGYDSAMLLFDAIKRAGAVDPAKITQALAATKDFAGVTGKITFDDKHNPNKTGIIMEFVDGKQVMKAKINL
ncbi:MAG: ABC transporter substrate-binding protein [Firmicutes bacterium]|nr:ABC transporter substrate-binding protein [Bacillota bacterium]